MLDTITVMHRRWYYTRHGLLLLYVLVLRIYVTRLRAIHLCSTSTRISTACHIIVIIITRYCGSLYMILDTDHCYDMYMLHRYYDPSHSYVVVMSHRHIYIHHFTDTRYTDSIVTYASHTSVHACIVSIFLSYDSLCILYRLLFHVTIFML